MFTSIFFQTLVFTGFLNQLSPRILEIQQLRGIQVPRAIEAPDDQQLGAADRGGRAAAAPGAHAGARAEGQGWPWNEVNHGGKTGYRF